MSFFERAKAAANDLAAKADAEMKKAGISTPGASTGTGAYGAPSAPAGSGAPGAERALRDLGVLAYLEATGRAASPTDRERVLATLRELESSGRLGPLTVGPPAPGAPPPPPGAAGSASTAPPPPPAGSAPPPPPPGAAPPPPPPPPPPAGTTPPGSTPPPPPPSWA